MATEQIAVRLPAELMAVLDDLVTRGVYESRAAAVRAGIEVVVELDRRRLTDLAVIEGYRRFAAWERPRSDLQEGAGGGEQRRGG